MVRWWNALPHSTQVDLAWLGVMCGLIVVGLLVHSLRGGGGKR